MAFVNEALHLNRHVVLASTLACNIVYEISRVLSRQMFPKTFKTFRGFTEANWNIHVVSTVHCIVVIIGAFMILHDDELSKDRIFGYSARAANFYSISCGYFLWDMVTAIRYVKHQGIGMAFHGVASFAVFILSFRPFLNYYGAVFILYELSTPFLNFNWFMDKLGWTGSKIQLVNGIVLICTFFGARLIFGMQMSYQTWVEVYAVRDQVPIFYMLVYGVANVVLNSLNVYWFGLMIRMLIRRFSGKQPAPRVQ